jgi:hypothetical protein
MQTSTVTEVLLATPGVQTVQSVALHELATGGQVLTARLGFGPHTPAVHVVAILEVARLRVRLVAPDAVAVVLEPYVAEPRTDANPPTDVFVIRGAE